jgi:repressor LexA
VRDLTSRQGEILQFITREIARCSIPPTINEIQNQFLFQSPNAVEQHLRALEKKGYLKRHPNKSRGLELRYPVRGKLHPSRTTIEVPILGRISAGAPRLAEQDLDSSIVIDGSLLAGRGRLFALRVQGESMIEAGIYQGDMIIARQQSTAESGEIIVALLSDEATVKRFIINRRLFYLKPENKQMDLIDVSGRKDFKILGKVIACWRNL